MQRTGRFRLNRGKAWPATGWHLPFLCAFLAFSAHPDQTSQSLLLPGVDPELTAPFRPLVVVDTAQDDSGIDWGNRTLIARGRGLQQGVGGQSVLMAKAAAKDFALRNAVALAGGIEIGVDGRLKDFRSGRYSISARVKGAEVTRYESVVENGRTYWIAEIRLPLVGVASLSADIYDLARRSHRRVSRDLRRLHPGSSGFEAPPDNRLLLIDARGSGLRPSLFPILVGSADQLVLDVESVPREQVVEQGLCRFVTTDLSADELVRGPVVASLAMPRPRGPVVDAIRLPALGADLLPRRILVEGDKAVGPERSFLRLSEQATQRLAQDQRAASLLYGGKVMVIVDAASTGQDGHGPGGRWLAHSPPRR